MDDRVVLYRDASGGWRWRRTAPNGEPVAASSEAYRDRADAIANLQRVNGATTRWELADGADQ